MALVELQALGEPIDVGSPHITQDATRLEAGMYRDIQKNLFQERLRQLSAKTNIHSALDAFLKQLGYKSIPLRRTDRTGSLFAEGAIGSHKQVFLIDSAASVTLIDQKIVRDVKSLGELNAELNDTVLGKLTNDSTLLIQRMTLGTLSFSNQPAAPTELPLGSRKLNSGVVLGYDFLLRNDCVCDCVGERLYFREFTLPQDLQGILDDTLQKSGYQENIIQTNFEPRLTSNLKVEGQNKPVVIDAASSFFYENQALIDFRNRKMWLRPPENTK